MMKRSLPAEVSEDEQPESTKKPYTHNKSPGVQDLSTSQKITLNDLPYDVLLPILAYSLELNFINTSRTIRAAINHGMNRPSFDAFEHCARWVRFVTLLPPCMWTEEANDTVHIDKVAVLGLKKSNSMEEHVELQKTVLNSGWYGSAQVQKAIPELLQFTLDRFLEPESSRTLMYNMRRRQSGSMGLLRYAVDSDRWNLEGLEWKGGGTLPGSSSVNNIRQRLHYNHGLPFIRIYILLEKLLTTAVFTEEHVRFLWICSNLLWKHINLGASGDHLKWEWNKQQRREWDKQQRKLSLLSSNAHFEDLEIAELCYKPEFNKRLFAEAIKTAFRQKHLDTIVELLWFSNEVLNDADKGKLFLSMAMETENFYMLYLILSRSNEELWSTHNAHRLWSNTKAYVVTKMWRAKNPELTSWTEKRASGAPLAHSVRYLDRAIMRDYPLRTYRELIKLASYDELWAKHHIWKEWLLSRKRRAKEVKDRAFADVNLPGRTSGNAIIISD